MTSAKAYRALLEPLYEAFNRQDVPAMLGGLDPEVEWRDVINGVPIKGREAVGEYWHSQFELVRSELSPLTYTPLPDGRVEVDVAQTVRRLDGGLWANQRVTHTYTFSPDGLIVKMVPS
jgi:hypothetical protein